jgi:transcription elongation factor GreA
MYLTPGGMLRLKNRIEGARASYQAIVADNPAALESGDTSGWHDNFAFEENQRQMHRLGRLVHDLEALYGQATLTPLPKKSETVVIGTRVQWRFIGENDFQSCWIAGWDDGDPDKNRVSYSSPFGQALIGAEVGEERSVRVGSVLKVVEIMEIEPISEQDDLK